MKITKLETIRLLEFPNILWVRVHGEDGLYGLGETFMAAASVEAFLHEIVAPRILGVDAHAIDLIASKLYGYLGFRSSGVETRAASAVDIALWDLWGKATNQPVVQLLGGRTRERIRTYNTCAGYQYIRDTRLQQVENWGLGNNAGPYEDLEGFLHRADEVALSLLEQGITGMKIWPFDPAAEASGGHYISGPDLDRALEPFRKIRGAVGNKMDIMVEFHSMWNLPTAIRIARALEPFDTFWHEDPIKMDALADLATYAAASRAPVCASETLAFRQSFRELLEARAAGIVMLDLSWCGGLSEAKKIATMAEAYHLPVAPHDCTGPVVLAASTHLSCNAPNALIQESVRAFYTGWYQELVTALPEVKDGMIAPPPGPGLGLDLLPDIDGAQGRGRAQQRRGLMLELASQQLRLAVRPAIGGAVAQFDWLGGAEPVSLFRAWDGHSDDPNRHGCYPLVPWSNRISGGGIDAGAAFWPLQPNWQGAPYPIHGDGWQRPWVVAEHTDAKLRLTLDSRAQPPFDYRAELTYALAGPTLTMRPDGGASRRDASTLRPRLSPLVPAHTGYHAASQGGDQSGWRRPITCRPARAELSERPHWDFSSERPLPSAWVNNGFSGWDGEAVIDWPRAWRCPYRSRPMPVLSTYILYSPSADADFFCFEPVTHPVDAFHLPGMPGLVTLAQGERLTAACTVHRAGARAMTAPRIRITALRTTTVAVPLEAPLRHANGCHWGRFVRTLVEVDTDAGITGLGEMGGGGESARARVHGPRELPRRPRPVRSSRRCASRSQPDREPLQQPHPAPGGDRVRLPRHHGPDARRARPCAARRQAARRGAVRHLPVLPPPDQRDRRRRGPHGRAARGARARR